MRIDRVQLTILLILGVFVTVFVVGAWRPHYCRIAALKTEIEARQATLHHLQDQQVDASLNVAPLFAARVATFDRAVPVKAGLGPLLERLSCDLAAESVVVRQLQANTVIEGDEVDRIPITLQFEGPFPSLFRLLQRFESDARILRIDRIDVSSSTGEPGATLVIDVEMSTFARRAQEGAA